MFLQRGVFSALREASTALLGLSTPSEESSGFIDSQGG